MTDLAKPVRKFLLGWLENRFVFGYILVDPQGVVRSWGGDLESLGLPALEKDRPVSDQLLFTEGLFPVEVPSLYLPMVKIDPDRSLDVHLFQTEQGHGLLLMDVTEQDRVIAQWQQKANALAIRLAGEEKAGARISDRANEMYAALDIAAMRLEVNGTFQVQGRPPEWLADFCPDQNMEHISCLTSGDSFSFLENFLDDAHAFWRRNQIGCIKSGLWIESGSGGKEHYFEAIAVTTAHDKILLITRDLSHFNEKQHLLQAGREIAVKHNVLQGLQRELITSRNALEERVRQRTRQLQEANARLANELASRRQLEKERIDILRQLQQAQKMEAIGTLASGIAHDFNNILSAILGYTELSLDETPQNSVLRQNLTQVLHATDRARDLIRQILTFSRQSKIERKPVQPKAILKETLKLLRACLPASIEIEDEIESDAFVMADATQLHQVIMNLCTNATQAMQTSGGMLTLRLHDIQLHPADMAANPELHTGPHVELTIRDSGQGMTDEVLKRIFDPFFTTKEEGKGTGMGLSVVHGIVKSCHGAILATSKVGVGSVFRVLLPAAPSSDSREIQTASNIPSGHERILFIDDEHIQVELASQMLGKMGYTVVGLSDCLQAIEQFSGAPDQFDLVISDMNMPKINGWAMTQKLRQIRPDIPIILCSGGNDCLFQGKALEQQVQGYLTKPVPMIEMARVIRQVLDQ
jgi:signal transduction histidine kinase